jgi:Holliday junction resolvasome RuvABC endonuclease subunit
MTTLLSLDTSTTSTGWAIFKDGEYQESGVIDDFKKVKNGYERLKLMTKELLDSIGQLKPDIIVIEKDVVFGNMKVIDMLMKIIGAVYGFCLFNGITYYEFAPSEWRKYVKLQAFGRKRDEFKKASIKYIKDNLNMDVNDDEADAICIGLAYCKKFG